MGHLLVAKPAPEETASVTRIGGRPVAPPGTAWPTCKECKGPMQFVAQIRLSELRDPALADRLLLIFQCQNKPGMCDDWSAESGANRALLVAPGGTPLAPPAGKATALSRTDGVGLEPLPAGADYGDVVGGRPEVLGQAGGSPAWIQADETPTCSCGKPMRFVVQLEDRGGGGINFGDAGCGYGFVCSTCADQARFLWQCG